MDVGLDVGNVFVCNLICILYLDIAFDTLDN